MIKILKENINDDLFKDLKDNIAAHIEFKIDDIYQNMLKNIPELTKEVLNDVIGIEYINTSGDLYDLDSMDDEDKEILQSKLNKIPNIINSQELISIVDDIVKDYFNQD